MLANVFIKYRIKNVGYFVHNRMCHIIGNDFFNKIHNIHIIHNYFTINMIIICL